MAVFASLPNDVAVTPSQLSAPLVPGTTQQFHAAVGGSSDQSITWSLLPSLGRITPDGLYIAPDAIEAPQTVLIVATSRLASVLFGTALVILSPG